MADIAWPLSPGKAVNLPKTDFSRLSNADLLKTFKSTGFPAPTGLDFSNPLDRSASILPATTSAVPEIDKNTQSWVEAYKALSPTRIQEMQAAADIAAQSSQQQLQQLYPLLSAAGAETTARNLAASQAYRRFAEQLPSSVQSIMASKQSQVQSAQAGEAALQQATALQQQAAKDFAGKFAGQYISYS